MSVVTSSISWRSTRASRRWSCGGPLASRSGLRPARGDRRPSETGPRPDGGLRPAGSRGRIGNGDPVPRLPLRFDLVLQPSSRNGAEEAHGSGTTGPRSGSAWCEPHQVAALRLAHFQERIHDRDQIVGWEPIQIGEQVELVAGKCALGAPGTSADGTESARVHGWPSGAPGSRIPGCAPSHTPDTEPRAASSCGRARPWRPPMRRRSNRPSNCP